MPREAAFFGGGEVTQLVASCAGLGADLTELLAEFVDSAGRVHDLVLARVKRVRLGRHFDLYQRVILTFKFDGLAGLYGGAGQEFEVARQVMDNNFTVLGVNAFFHCSLALLG
jgi:hypothetical protein